MLDSKSDIANPKRVSRILLDLARNAAAIRDALNDNDLEESARLVGAHTGLVEELRSLRDAKVSIVSSDIKGDMNLLMNDIQNDVSEALKTIREKSLKLLTGLAGTRSARKIAAYAALRHPAYSISKVSERDKIQGGRYGY